MAATQSGKSRDAIKEDAALLGDGVLPCHWLREPGGLDIVNETNQPLYNVEVIPPDGGRWRYTTNDCSDRDLTVTTEDGTVFAELTEKWCPGQVWAITGKDDSSLRDG